MRREERRGIACVYVGAANVCYKSDDLRNHGCHVR